VVLKFETLNGPSLPTSVIVRFWPFLARTSAIWAGNQDRLVRLSNVPVTVGNSS
jgi:hypothetical protein